MNREEFGKNLAGLERISLINIAWRHYRRAEKAQSRIEVLEKENLGLLDAMILHSLPIEKKP